jgi:hypothetical protein
MHLKLLENQEQVKPQVSRWKEIIKIKAEINEMETKITIQRIKETKSHFFEKIKKIDKPLTKLTKRKKRKTKINKIIDEKGVSQQIQLKSKESLGNTSINCILINWKNLDEMEIFLDTYDL